MIRPRDIPATFAPAVLLVLVVAATLTVLSVAVAYSIMVM